MTANEDFAALDQIYRRAGQHTVRTSPQTDYTSPVVTVVLFTLFACLAWPYLSEGRGPLDVGGLLHALQDMASRLSFGLVRRPLPSETSALTSVFGLKSSGGGVSGVKGLGSETLQRSIGGLRSIMVKSGEEPAGEATPPGLGNWDNSCYQNSVIQGLASLRSLPDFLLRVASRRRSDREDGAQNARSMNEALLETVGRLNDAQNGGKALWLPPELKTMSTWQQQDAQEYFSKILDKLDKEALEVAQRDMASLRRSPGLSLSSQSAPRETLDEEVISEDSERNRRVDEELRNPLDGMIAQRVACTACGHSEGLSLFPFNCLTVPLGRASHYDIRDCLDSYTALEDIDGVHCPKCTLLSFQTKLTTILSKTDSQAEALHQQLQHRLQTVDQALEENDFSDNAITKKCQIPKKQWVESTKTKQAVVARAPRGLVIHVNRSVFNEYTGAQIKNPAMVQFPTQFGLGPWMLGGLQNLSSSGSEKKREEKWTMDPVKSMLPDSEEAVASDARYELSAVLTHSGRHENGHYMCYRKFGYEQSLSDDVDANAVEEPRRDAWWRLSDENVTKVGEEFVLGQGGVFMLFYEKVDGLPLEHKTDSATLAVMDEDSVAEAAGIPLPLDFDEDFDVEVDLTEPPSAHATVDEQPLAKSTSPGQLPTPPDSVADPITESDLDSVIEEPATSAPHYPHEPVQAIRMRTSNVFTDDRNKAGSTENLLMGNRMVSAS